MGADEASVVGTEVAVCATLLGTCSQSYVLYKGCVAFWMNLFALVAIPCTVRK